MNDEQTKIIPDIVEGRRVHYFSRDGGYRLEKVIKVDGDKITVATCLYNKPVRFAPGKCRRKSCRKRDKWHNHRSQGGKRVIDRKDVLGVYLRGTIFDLPRPPKKQKPPKKRTSPQPQEAGGP